MGRGKSIRQLGGLAAVLAVVVISIAGLVTFVILSSNNTSDEGNVESAVADAKTYTDPTTGLTLNYSHELELKANNPPIDTVLMNITKSDPRVQITAWYEEGDSIAKLGTLQKPLNEVMLDNVKLQLDNIYPGAKITDEKLMTVNGFEAGELIFDYTTGAGLETTQRLLVIIKDSDTAVTIANQALRDQFEEVNTRYFDQIINSAKFE